MSPKSSIKMSQGLDVLKPKIGQAFPIPCIEWDVIKENIESVTTEPWLFHTMGSLLLGGCLATAISVLIGAVSTNVYPMAVVVAWAIVAVCGLTGIACLFFAHKERHVHRDKAQNVLTQMRLIELRFESPES